MFVTARATAAQIGQVFSTKLGYYEVEKRELRDAPMTPPWIPAAIASRVSTVLGLSTSRVKSGAAIRAAMASSSKTSPPTCADYYDEYFDTVDPPYGGGYPYPAPSRNGCLRNIVCPAVVADCFLNGANWGLAERGWGC